MHISAALVAHECTISAPVATRMDWRSVQRRLEVDPGSTRGRFGANWKSILDRSEVDPGSIEDRLEVDLESTSGRSMVDCRTIQDRPEVEPGSSENIASKVPVEGDVGLCSSSIGCAQFLPLRVAEQLARLRRSHDLQNLDEGFVSKAHHLLKLENHVSIAEDVCTCLVFIRSTFKRSQHA